MEIDPGFTVTWLYYDYIDNDGYGDKGSNYRNDFGMTCGIGVANNLMRIMLKWKTIFDVERASKSSVYIWAASFMILTIGVPIAG